VLGGVGGRKGAAAAHQVAVARVGLGARRMQRVGHGGDGGGRGPVAVGEGALLVLGGFLDRGEALLGAGTRRVGGGEGEVGGGAGRHDSRLGVWVVLCGGLFGSCFFVVAGAAGRV